MRVKEKTINLLPKEYIQAEKVKKGLIIAGGILALEVIGFIFFVAMPPKAEILETEKQLDSLAIELNNDRFAEVNLMIQQLETAKTDVGEWMALYDELKRENFVSKRVLDSLVARVPLDLTINKLTVMPEEKDATSPVRTIKIEGNSVEAIAVLNYTTIIEQAFGPGTTNYEVTYDEELMVYKYTIDVTIPVEIKSIQEVSNEAVDVATDTTNESTEVSEGGAN